MVQIRVIVAIVRILVQLIYTILNNNTEFINKIDSPTERRMKSMIEDATNVKVSDSIMQSVNLIRQRLLTKSSDQLFFIVGR